MRSIAIYLGPPFELPHYYLSFCPSLSIVEALGGRRVLLLRVLEPKIQPLWSSLVFATSFSQKKWVTYLNSMHLWITFFINFLKGKNLG